MNTQELLRACATAAAIALGLMHTGARAQHVGPAMPMPVPMSSSSPDPTGQSRPDPVTPRPPENTSGPMSMPVSDNMIAHQVLLDRFESTRSRDGTSGMAWDLQAWVGRDSNRLWVKSEGERNAGRTEQSRLDLLWSRPVAAFWDVQAGLRHDFGQGAHRNWLAAGVQGIAPYWFDVDAAFYVGNGGRTALRLAGEYEFVLSQKTFLAPEAEVSFYGRRDPESGIGAGLSHVRFGVRLRHEIRREFAPYVGVSWIRSFGETAGYARAAGRPAGERQWVAGVRMWF